MNYHIAFGGGAFRGIGHIGAIKCFEEKGITPITISGTSIGAIIGAFYSLGYSSKEMEQFAKEIQWKNFFKPSIKHGLINKKLITETLSTYLKGALFEDTKIPLKIIATNFDNGTKKVFEQGSILDAILASISIPGLFLPHKLDGVNYIDGSISENLPITCLPKGPKIGISVQIPIEFLEQKKTKRKIVFLNRINMVQRAMSITMKQNEEESIRNSDGTPIIIKIKGYQIGYYDFKQIDAIIHTGYTSAQELL